MRSKQLTRILTWIFILYTLHLTLYTSTAFCASKGNHPVTKHVIARSEATKQSLRLLRSLRSLAMTMNNWLCPNVYAASKGNPPVAHWRFDESGGPTAYDESANNNDGTLNAGASGTNTAVGQMWTRQGKIGGALELDGTNDYVSIPISSSLQPQSELTLEAWIKPDSTYAGDIIILGPSAYYLTYSNGGGVNCYWYGKSPAGYHSTVTGLAPSGVWSHIVAVWSASTVKIYVNGVEKLSVACTGTGSQAVNQVWIGAEASGTTRQFRGLIDDVKIYNYARTADQIMVDYNAGMSVYLGGGTDPNEGNPPVGYWAFDENTGDYAYDHSGNGNNGTLGGGTANYKPIWSAGKYGSALKFDGTNDMVEALDTNNTLDLTTAGTIECWAYINNSYRFWITAKCASASNPLSNYYFGTGSGNTWLGGIGNGTTQQDCSDPNVAPTGIWTHAAFTFDGTKLKLYINGIKVREVDQTITPLPNNDHLSIGCWGTATSYPANGYIDEIRIYNYARTQAQITYDYNKGKPIAHYKFEEGGGAIAKNEYSTADTGAAPVGWWRMDNSWTDASGNGSNGTASGGATFSSSGKIGPYGGSFDGIDDYVNIGDVSIADFNSNSDFTLEAWINPSAASTGAIISNENSNESGYNLIFTKDRNITFVVGGAVSDGLVLQLDAANTGSYSGTGDYWYDLSGGSHTGTLGGGDNGFIGKPVWNSDGYFTFSGTDNCIELSPFSTIRTAIVGFYPTATNDVNIQYYQNGRRLFDYGDGWPSFVLDNYSIAVANYAGGQTPITWADESGVVSSDVFSLNTPNIAVGSITTRTNDGTGNYQSTFSVQLNNGTVSTAANKGIASDFGISRIGNGSRSSHTPANTASYHTNFEGRMYFVTAYNKILSSDERTQIFLSKAYRLGITNNATTTDTIPLNNYAQVVAKKEGATCSIYINGVLSKSFTCNLSQSLTGALRIGARTSGVSEYFSGKIDDARIYNYARTAEQIYNDYKTTHGTLVGDTRFVDGKISKALQFDGTGDYVITPGISELQITGDITVSSWVKDGGNGSGGIVGKMKNTPYAGYGITKQSNYFKFWTASSGSYTYTQSDTTYTDSNWHYVTGVRNNGTNYLYVDGKLQTSTATPPFADSGQDLVIGRYYSDVDNYYFNGLIDDIRIYNYARSADQVLQDYNAGMSSHTGASTGTADPWGGALPVGHWKLDENTGVLAKDASGNGNNGTLGADAVGTDIPTWTQGKVGPCLNFDGVDDYVKTGNVFNLTNLTLEAWIKPRNLSGWQMIVGSNSPNYWVLRCSGTNLMFTYTDDNNGGKTLSNDQWYHVAGTYDGTNKKLYVNGILISSLPVTAFSITNQAAAIGAYPDGNYRFNGYIDDVKIYNYARTQAQIAWDYNQGKPVGHWRFEEGSEATVYDDSDNNNDGTITIGATGTQTTVASAWTNGATGKFGKCMSFDGTDDYVSLGNSPTLNFTNNGTFSISVWVKPNTLTSAWRRGIISQEAYLTSGYRFGFANGGAPIFWTSQSGGTLSVSGGTLAVDQWNHIEVTYDNQQAYIYLNGAQTGSATGTYVAGTNILRLGYFINEYFSGLIDDVRVYNYARTAEQIRQDYNQGLAARLGE